jgi:hypothetical protein
MSSFLAILETDFANIVCWHAGIAVMTLLLVSMIISGVKSNQIFHCKPNSFRALQGGLLSTFHNLVEGPSCNYVLCMYAPSSSPDYRNIQLIL